MFIATDRRHTGKGSPGKSRKEVSQKSNLVDILLLDSEFPEMGEINFSGFCHLVCGNTNGISTIWHTIWEETLGGEKLAAAYTPWYLVPATGTYTNARAPVSSVFGAEEQLSLVV